MSNERGVLTVLERDFQAQIAQLYRERPVVEDEREFLAALHTRLDAYSRRRRRWLVCSGMLGGCVTLAALFQSSGIMLKSTDSSMMRAVLARAWQNVHEVVGALEPIHLAAVGAAAVLAYALRELVHAGSDAQD